MIKLCLFGLIFFIVRFDLILFGDAFRICKGSDVNAYLEKVCLRPEKVPQVIVDCR